MNHRGTEEHRDKLTEQVIGLAIEVHRQLGPGLLESAYEACLEHEFKLAGVPVERQVPLPLQYKGLNLSAGYRLDLWVQRKLVPEVKAVEQLLPVHEAQLLTYLRLSNCHVGLLLNFNVSKLRDGIKRMVL